MKTKNEEVSNHYDEIMYKSESLKFYGDSSFHNWGYWTPQTMCQREASEKLLEKLISMLPRNQGNILDVACGMGASTGCLLKYYSPENITAINISQKQILTCKQNNPECNFLVMDAAKLEFDDNYFDAILCVEAVFHFHTREDFLKQAIRTLKPGGSLVLSDVFTTKEALKISYIPEENWIESIEDYKELLTKTGFEEIQIIDATKECWGGFDDHMKETIHKEYEKGAITYTERTVAINIRESLSNLVTHYLLVSCKKPY